MQITGQITIKMFLLICSTPHGIYPFYGGVFFHPENWGRFENLTNIFFRWVETTNQFMSFFLFALNCISWKPVFFTFSPVVRKQINNHLSRSSVVVLEITGTEPLTFGTSNLG